MKTLYTIFLFILFTAATAAAQVLHIDSTRFITGTAVGTNIYNVIPTADKGLLFIGYDYGTPGGIIPSFPYGGNNVLIGKIDSNRQISWIKLYGGSGDEAAGPALQMPDGGYMILGGTSSSDGDVTGYKGGGGDIWLLRIDASGNLLWEKCYGSTMDDDAISIASTPDGGFIILGTSNGSDGDVPFHYGDMWSFDWVVIKIDSIGNKQWSKDIGTTQNEYSYGAILSVNNSYFLVGTSDGNDHDCTDTTWHSGVYSMEDYYVLKLDDTGKVLWDSSYGGSGNDVIQNALFDTRDSTIVIVGSSSSHDYMVTDDSGTGVYGDLWVVKVNTNGTLLWQKALGGGDNVRGTGLCTAYNGGYLAYGNVFPGPIGNSDCWLFALDNSGNEINNKIFGGTNGDVSAAIIPYQNGYVASGLSGSLVFTEGTTYGNFDTSTLNPEGGGAFVSYLEYWPLSVKNVVDSAATLKIYPNPATSMVTINIPENKQGNIIVMNSIGQVENRTVVVLQTSVVLNINGWASGLYIVLWQDASGQMLQAKLIKE